MNGWDKVWNGWPDWCGLSTHMAVWPLPSPPQPPASPAGATAVLSPLHTQHLCPQSSVFYTLSPSVLCPLSWSLTAGTGLRTAGLTVAPQQTLCSVAHTAHCTLHTAHYTLHTAHCTLYTSHCTLHTTLYTTHPTLHHAQWRRCQSTIASSSSRSPPAWQQMSSKSPPTWPPSFPSLPHHHPLLLLSHLTCPFSYSSVPNMWPFLNKATC